MTEEIKNLEAKIDALNEELFKLRAAAPAQPVSDYTFSTESGPVRLSDLFNGKKELVLIHNMGRGCDYCTMWADGFESMLRHIESRAAFVVVSPQSPEKQSAARAERGWTFRMVQDEDKNFTKDMGFLTEKEGWWPGTSAFVMNDDGTISRTGKAIFGPGDAFCPPWHFFSLFPGGAADWEPK